MIVNEKAYKVHSRELRKLGNEVSLRLKTARRASIERTSREISCTFHVNSSTASQYIGYFEKGLFTVVPEAGPRLQAYAKFLGVQDEKVERLVEILYNVRR